MRTVGEEIIPPVCVWLFLKHNVLNYLEVQGVPQIKNKKFGKVLFLIVGICETKSTDRNLIA